MCYESKQKTWMQRVQRLTCCYKLFSFSVVNVHWRWNPMLPFVSDIQFSEGRVQLIGCDSEALLILQAVGGQRTRSNPISQRRTGFVVLSETAQQRSHQCLCDWLPRAGRWWPWHATEARSGTGCHGGSAVGCHCVATQWMRAAGCYYSMRVRLASAGAQRQLVMSSCLFDIARCTAIIVMVLLQPRQATANMDVLTMRQLAVFYCTQLEPTRCANHILSPSNTTRCRRLVVEVSWQACNDISIHNIKFLNETDITIRWR